MLNTGLQQLTLETNRYKSNLFKLLTFLNFQYGDWKKKLLDCCWKKFEERIHCIGGDFFFFNCQIHAVFDLDKTRICGDGVGERATIKILLDKIQGGQFHVAAGR